MQDNKENILVAGKNWLAEKWTPEAQERFEKELADLPPEMSKEEQAYRRGYSHGFLAARRNEDLTEQEIYRWRAGYGTEADTAPPGSVFSGRQLSEVKKEFAEFLKQ